MSLLVRVLQAFFLCVIAVINSQATNTSTSTTAPGTLSGTTTLGLAGQSIAVSVLIVPGDDPPVTLTLIGPSTRWFSVGFGSSTMVGTYAIVILENGDIVEDTLTADNYALPYLQSALTPVSNTVNGTTRTVIVSRALNPSGDGDSYYVFKTASERVDIIAAVGPGTGWPDEHPANGYTDTYINIGDVTSTGARRLRISGIAPVVVIMAASVFLFLSSGDD